MKRIFIFIALLFVGLFLSGCKAKKVTVNFDLAGGQGTVAKQKVYKNGNVVEPKDPSKDGYEFLGWFLGDDKFDFEKGTDVNVTLVAKWKEIVPTETEVPPTKTESPPTGTEVPPTETEVPPTETEVPPTGTEVPPTGTEVPPTETEVLTVTVTFDSNGGTPVQSKTFEKGTKIDSIDIPEKEGFAFAYWMLDDGTPFNPNQPVNEDITVFANWTLILISIFYDSDGGEPANSEFNIFWGEKAPTVNDPVKEGYTFLGWYKDGELYDFNQPVYSELYLYAHWETNIENVVVIFLADNGDPGIFDRITIKKGSIITDVGIPEKEDYVFSGWLLNGEPFNLNTPITSNITLVANWISVYKTFNVFYNSDGGDPDTYEVDVVFGETAPLIEPTKEGYEFLGWYEDDKLYDFTKPVQKDLYLVAHWEYAEYIYVDFYWEEDEDGSVYVEILKGTIPEYMDNMFTNPGYKFIGWQINGVPYNFDTPLLEDTYLEPIWEMIIMAYVNSTPYVDAYEAAQSANPHNTIYLTKDYDGRELSVSSDNVTITNWQDDKAVVKDIIYISTNKIIIKNLEFTGNAQIIFDNNVNEFAFRNNKVYDITLSGKQPYYVTTRRLDSRGFIYSYSENLTLKYFEASDNEFSNINGNAIFLAPHTLSGSTLILGNKFTGMLHSALRIDPNGFDGNLRVEHNEFYDSPENAILINTFGFEVDNTNEQQIRIANNIFDNVATKDTLQTYNYSGTSAIVLDHNESEKVAITYITNNEFFDNRNSIYIDNTHSYSDNPPVFVVNDNTFFNNEGNYLYQKAAANPGSAVLVNFKYNAYLTGEGEPRMDSSFYLISDKMVNNDYYKSYYGDQTLIIDQEIYEWTPDLYVNSNLNSGYGDVITVSDKHFVYGITAFKSISAAMEVAYLSSNIYLDPEGYYNEDIVIDKAGIRLYSASYLKPYNDPDHVYNTAVIAGEVTIRANRVTIAGILFAGVSRIVFDPIDSHIDGFEFANNSVGLYAGILDHSRGFIEAIDENGIETYKNFVIRGNEFSDLLKLTPIVLKNVQNTYILNNSFTGHNSYSNNAIVLTGDNSERKGTGVTGAVYIYRNIFNEYGEDIIIIDNYKNMNLNMSHNDFIGISTSALKINRVATDNYRKSRMALHQNTFDVFYGHAIGIELVEGPYDDFVFYAYNNHFKDEAFYYMKNTANIQKVYFNYNQYDYGVVDETKFINVTSFGGNRDRFNYYGIIS